MIIGEVAVQDLEIGDRMLLMPDAPYGWATVVSVENTPPPYLKKVGIVRPYIHTDIEYGTNPQRVIDYIGTERMLLYGGGAATYRVHRVVEEPGTN